MRAACVLILVLLAGAASPPPADRAEVSIRGSRYAPPTVRIAAGGTVTWTNMDNLDHTVVADDGSFSSRTLKRGDTFEFTFKKPGTYAYGCRLHPRMRGSVTVDKR